MDSLFATKVRGGQPRVDEAIAAFDTATLHEAANTAIVTGPTGHNLADVHVLVNGYPG